MVETCTSANLSDFNRATRPIVKAVLEIIDELDEFLPLTVRQVYYQLVARLIVENSLNEYRKISRLLVAMRERNLVPWKAIEDRSRRTVEKRGYTDLEEYLSAVIEYFDPANYGRCYVQGQGCYVEVTSDKDALSTILTRTLYPFCTRLNIIRGQCSATMVERMARRFDEAIMRGQVPVLLHLGDLDPSGVAIPKAIIRNLAERHALDVELRIIGLTPQQVDEFNLPINPEGAQKTDPNYTAWVSLYGPRQPAVELDALPPPDLKRLLREALTSVYDMASFKDETFAESEERDTLALIRSDVLDLLHGYGLDIE